MKTYSAHDRAGCVQLRRARETGYLVGVYHCEQAEMDGDEGYQWATVCEEHNTVVIHSSLRLAKDHAAAPTGWCEACMLDKRTPTEVREMGRSLDADQRRWLLPDWGGTCTEEARKAAVGKGLLDTNGNKTSFGEQVTDYLEDLHDFTGGA